MKSEPVAAVSALAEEKGPLRGSAVSGRAQSHGTRQARIMADEPEDLMLRMLRRMDAKLDRLIDVLALTAAGGMCVTL